MPLRHILAELYPQQQDIRRVLDEAEIDTSRIPLGSSAVNDWTEAIAEAERQGKWPRLVIVALRDYPENRDLWKAISARVEAQRAAAHDMATPNPPRNGEYVTYREYARDRREIEGIIEETERRIMETVNRYNEERRKELETWRHALREELTPKLLSAEAMRHVADRRLIAQAVITGLVILGGMALMLLSLGSNVFTGG